MAMDEEDVVEVIEDVLREMVEVDFFGEEASPLLLSFDFLSFFFFLP